MIPVVVGLDGLGTDSFSNVVIYWVSLRRPIIWPSSRRPHCGERVWQNRQWQSL